MTLSQSDIDKLKNEFKKEFATRDELVSKLDTIIHYSKTTADELVITQSKISDHESRIRRIEDNLALSSAN